MMNDRERYLETLLFGSPDRIPFSPGGPRESTLRAWRAQGLPEDVSWYARVRELIGLEPPSSKPRPGVWLRHTMIPEFEEKVIEEREDSLIVQDWKGNICAASTTPRTSSITTTGSLPSANATTTSASMWPSSAWAT